MDMLNTDIAASINKIAADANAAYHAVEALPLKFRIAAQAGIERSAAVEAAKIVISAGLATEPTDNPNHDHDMACDSYLRQMCAIGKQAFAAAFVAAVSPLMPHDADI